MKSKIEPRFSYYIIKSVLCKDMPIEFVHYLDYVRKSRFN